jgi:hypothetical protein
MGLITPVLLGLLASSITWASLITFRTAVRNLPFKAILAFTAVHEGINSIDLTYSLPPG